MAKPSREPRNTSAQATARLRHAGLRPTRQRVELAGNDLRKDPVLLADEARSTSLFGDTRHIYIRATGDEAHDAVKNLLDTIDAGRAAKEHRDIVEAIRAGKPRAAEAAMRKHVLASRGRMKPFYNAK